MHMQCSDACEAVVWLLESFKSFVADMYYLLHYNYFLFQSLNIINILSVYTVWMYFPA